MPSLGIGREMVKSKFSWNRLMCLDMFTPYSSSI